MINISEYISIKKSFEKKYNEYQIEIKIHKDLVCKNWTIIGGKLNRLFSNSYLDKIQTLKINLANCSRIDPFPMMLLRIKNLGFTIFLDLRETYTMMILG